MIRSQKSAHCHVHRTSSRPYAVHSDSRHPELVNLAGSSLHTKDSLAAAAADGSYLLVIL